MTPLERIKNWFIELPYEFQLELPALSYVMHYDSEIAAEEDHDERTSKYICYMAEQDLDGFEVLKRTLLLVALFDFSLYGRDTEEAWEKALDRSLDAKNNYKHLGQSTEFIDQELALWQKRKYQWITLSKDWKDLKREYLSQHMLHEYLFKAYDLG